MPDVEVTSGGSVVHRYENHKYAFKPPTSGADHIEELTGYLSDFLGPSGWVSHELLSDKVHIDVLPFPPTDARPFWTFVTSGMSDLPMNVPEGIEPAHDYQYAEMVISLPREWFPGVNSFGDINFNDENYWPIALLKFLARFPHEYNAWLWTTHTMPNGNPPAPYAVNTRLSGALVWPPMTWPSEKRAFQRSDGACVNFLAIYPLYGDEMTIKLSKGSETLFDMMKKANLTEILDPTRKSLASKRGRLWGLLRN